MFDLERELSKWREQLLIGGIYSPTDVDELETHVLDAVDDLQERGLTQEEAFWVAVHRLGDVESLNMEFGKVGIENEQQAQKSPIVQAEQEKPSPMAGKSGKSIGLSKKILVAAMIFMLVTAGSVFYAQVAPRQYQTMAILMHENVDATFPGIGSRALVPLQHLTRAGDFVDNVAKKMAEEEINCHANEIRSNISLRVPKDTGIIEVIATSNEPRKAAAMANASAEILIQELAKMKSTDSVKALEFLKEQMTIVDRNLREAETRLKTFMEKEGILSAVPLVTHSGGPGEENENRYRYGSLVGQLSDLQSQLIYIQNEKDLTQAELNSINSMIEERKEQLALEEMPQLTGSITPQVDQLRKKVADWQLELAALRDTYSEEHYKVVELKQKIVNAENRLQLEISKLIESQANTYSTPEWESLLSQALMLDMQLRGYEEKERLAARKIEEFKNRHHDLIDKEVELVRLEREARIREKTYMLLTDRYEEMLLQQQINAPRVRMIDTAFPPASPIRPNRIRIITLGMFLGAILGIGVALFFEIASRRKRSPQLSNSQ